MNRAKLYYLRGKVGKRARVRAKRGIALPASELLVGAAPPEDEVVEEELVDGAEPTAEEPGPEPESAVEPEPEPEPTAEEPGPEPESTVEPEPEPEPAEAEEPEAEPVAE